MATFCTALMFHCTFTEHLILNMVQNCFFSFLFHSMTLFLDILLMKTSEWPLAARGAASDKSGRERANALSPCTRLNRSSWSAQAARLLRCQRCVSLCSICQD